jgi:hypothetical protein
MMAAAPGGMGGGGGYGGGPAEDATVAPLSVDNASFATTTPEPTGIGGAEGYNTPAPDTRAVQPPEDTAKRTEPANPWPYVWLGLAAALTGSALLVRWANVRAFRRKAAQKQK